MGLYLLDKAACVEYLDVLRALLADPVLGGRQVLLGLALEDPSAPAGHGASPAGALLDPASGPAAAYPAGYAGLFAFPMKVLGRYLLTKWQALTLLASRPHRGSYRANR